MTLHELLLSFPNPPLIPCETAVNLLKIESSMYLRFFFLIREITRNWNIKVYRKIGYRKVEKVFKFRLFYFAFEEIQSGKIQNNICQYTYIIYFEFSCFILC